MVVVVSVAVDSVTVVKDVTVVAVAVVAAEVINTVDFTHVPQSAGQFALMTSPATGLRQLISAKFAQEAGSRFPLQIVFVVVVPVAVVVVVVVVVVEVVEVVLVVNGTHVSQRTGHVARTPRTSGSSDKTAMAQMVSLKLVHSSGSGRPLQTGVWVMTGHESHITGHLALTTPPTTGSEQVEGLTSVQS